MSGNELWWKSRLSFWWIYPVSKIASWPQVCARVKRSCSRSRSAAELRVCSQNQVLFKNGYSRGGVRDRSTHTHPHTHTHTNITQRHKNPSVTRALVPSYIQSRWIWASWNESFLRCSSCRLAQLICRRLCVGAPEKQAECCWVTVAHVRFASSPSQANQIFLFVPAPLCRTSWSSSTRAYATS